MWPRQMWISWGAGCVTACLRRSGDCFSRAFGKYRCRAARAARRKCVPCGSTDETVHWWRVGGRAERCQLFFEGDGAARKDGGMRKAKAVITAEISMCNRCEDAACAHLRST